MSYPVTSRNGSQFVWGPGGEKIPYGPSLSQQQQQDLLYQQRQTDQANTAALQQQSALAGQKQNQLDRLLNDYSVQKFLTPSTQTSSSSASSGSVGFPLANYGIGGTGVSGGMWTPSPAAAQIQAPTLDTSGSRAAFAKAKGTVANSLTGLLKASRDNFAGRNLSGGTAEVNAMGNILLGGNKQLADTVQANAIGESNAANQLAQTAYQGAITQRGQDISAADAMRAAGLTARGQDMEQARASQSLSQSQSQNSLASLMGLLNAFKTLY